MAKVIYYISKSGKNPVAEFLDSIEKKDKAKFFRIFKNVEYYGLDSIIPNIKKMTGLPLWEIRILGQNNLRIIYAIFVKDEVIVLHGFKKKIQKTPNRELVIAMKRFAESKKKT